MEGRSEPHFLEDEIISFDNCNYLKIVSKEKSLFVILAIAQGNGFPSASLSVSVSVSCLGLSLTLSLPFHPLFSHSAASSLTYCRIPGRSCTGIRVSLSPGSTWCSIFGYVQIYTHPQILMTIISLKCDRGFTTCHVLNMNCFI